MSAYRQSPVAALRKENHRLKKTNAHLRRENTFAFVGLVVTLATALFAFAVATHHVAIAEQYDAQLRDARRLLDDAHRQSLSQIEAPIRPAFVLGESCIAIYELR